MTFFNPKLFPTPLESEQLVSLVDLLPTLATLLDAPKSAYPKRKKRWSGVDFSSVVLNPRKAKKVQDYTIFTFDDYQAGQTYVFTNGTVGFWPQEPAHLGTCTFVFNASLPFLFLTSFSLTRMHTHHFPTFSLPPFLPPSTSRHSREALEDCHVLRPRRSRHKHAATMGTL